MRAVTTTGSYHNQIGPNPGDYPPDAYSVFTGTYSTTQVSTYSTTPCSGPVTVCSGSMRETRFGYQFGAAVYDTETVCTQASDCSWSGVAIDNLTGHSTPITCGGFGGAVTVVTTYAGEDTGESTADLIGRVTSDMGDFPDTWGGACSAFRNLSDDESSFSIRKFKWRLKHAPSGTCYLKVWLQRVFSPEGGGAPTVTPLSPYTWSGSGNPCLPAPDKPVDHEDNQIIGNATTEDVPDTDGTVTIEVVKWSCLPSYTPPDDGSANGYPVEEEA